MRIGAVLSARNIVLVGPGISTGALVPFCHPSAYIVVMRIGAIMAARNTMCVIVCGMEAGRNQLVGMIVRRGKAEARNSHEKDDNEDYSNSFFHAIILLLSVFLFHAIRNFWLIEADCTGAGSGNTAKHQRKHGGCTGQVHQDSSQFLLHL